MYDSEIAAALALYDSLIGSNFPSGNRWPIYFGQAPLYDAQQVNPPFVVLIDNGNDFQMDFNANQVENGGFTLEFYANTVEELDEALKAVKWNGQAPVDRAGFDGGKLKLRPPLVHLSLAPGREVRSYTGAHDKTGKRVYMLSKSYNTMSQVRGTGEV